MGNDKSLEREVVYPHVVKSVTIHVGLEALAGLSRPDTNRLKARLRWLALFQPWRRCPAMCASVEIRRASAVRSCYPWLRVPIGCVPGVMALVGRQGIPQGVRQM